MLLWQTFLYRIRSELEWMQWWSIYLYVSWFRKCELKSAALLKETRFCVFWYSNIHFDSSTKLCRFVKDFVIKHKTQGIKIMNNSNNSNNHNRRVILLIRRDFSGIDLKFRTHTVWIVKDGIFLGLFTLFVIHSVFCIFRYQYLQFCLSVKKYP